MTYEQLLSSWMHKEPMVAAPLEGSPWDMIREAIEKQIPKKPYRGQVSRKLFCPNCDNDEIDIYNTVYCSSCGQKIDWSEEDDY